MGVQCTQNPIFFTCLKAHCLSEGCHITLLCWADPLTPPGRWCWGTSPLTQTAGHAAAFSSSISWVLGIFSKQHRPLLSRCLRPGGFLPLLKVQWGAPYNPYTTHWPTTNYWKVTTESHWTWGQCSITAMGKHQGAAAHSAAFQTVMATGCSKVRKSSHPRTTSKMAKTILLHKFR